MPYVTLDDIARKAGVSIATVSRALNNKDAISSSTKETILKLAKQMGYTPNAVARGLKTHRTRTIGVVITDISDPFFAPIVRGIENAARQEGYHIILCDTNEDYQMEKEVLGTLMERRVDGLLLTPVQTSFEDILELKKKRVAFVLLCRHFDFELLVEIDSVATDDVEGACLATTHLLEKGHRRILFINGPTYVSSAKERLAGYKRALLEAGVKFDQSFIREGGIKMEDGYRITKEELNGPVRFTAIFAYSDFVALGVMKALREANLAIPEDIALVGYDDIDVSSFLEVPLTTVRIPKYELGMQGFKLLRSRLAGEAESTQKVMLNAELVVRRST